MEGLEAVRLVLAPALFLPQTLDQHLAHQVK